MKIVVCAKVVATLGDEVEFTDDGTDVDPELLEWSVNEWDTYATEEALRLREAAGEGEVVVATVGGEDAEEAIRRCLAMGADRALRIDPGPGPQDPLSVARALAGPIAEEGPDLVLTGVQSSDAVQAATGGMLAALLELPSVAVVTELAHQDGTLVVHRELEGGLVDLVEVAMPALLTIQTGINEPRYATLRAIKQARQKEITVRAMEADGAPCYRIRQMFVPARGEGATMLGDDPGEVAQRITELVQGQLR